MTDPNCPPTQTPDDVDLQLELAWESHQRNHNFGTNFDSFALHFGRRFKYGAGLHFRNLGINDPEPATAMTKHRIKFVQLVHAP